MPPADRAPGDARTRRRARYPSVAFPTPTSASILGCMSTYVTLPSDVEATSLGELLEDCRAMAAPRVVDLRDTAVPEVRLPAPRQALVIPESAREIAGAFGA